MLKRLTGPLLKTGISVAIIIWLLKKGTLDFSNMASLLQHSYLIAIASVLFIAQIYVAFLRWRSILQIKSSLIPKSFRMLMIQWIGQFFSAAIPGAVVGDVVKITYIQKIDNKLSKSFLFFSIFFDRIVGLISLLIISGLTSLIFYSELSTFGEDTNRLLFGNIILLLGGLSFLLVFSLPLSFFDWLLTKINNVKIKKYIERFIKLKISPLHMMKLLFISMVSQVLGFISFYIINFYYYQAEIQFKQLALLLPLGQISVAIPISPSGLGVGHLAFQKLFSYLGHTNGANLFNNFWFLCFFVNLMGLIPYILLRQKNK